MTNAGPAWQQPAPGNSEDIARWAREWPTPQQANEKEQERKLLLQLARDYASLNNRIIEVRQKAPSGLLTNETLANAYLALQTDVDGASGQTLNGIRAIVARVNALRVKAGQVEQVLAAAPAAPAAVAWALSRPEACVKNAMQRMRDALNQPVPDANAWTTAVADLGTMQTDIATYRGEEAKLHYAACLSSANKTERQKLEALKQRIDSATGATAATAFATALPLLQELGRLLEACGKARTDREALLRKPRVDFVDFERRIKAALATLNSLKSEFFAGFEDAAKNRLPDIASLLAGEGEVTERAVQSALDQLKGLTEKAEKTVTAEEQRVADERQREADRKSYPRYKFSDCTTWAMQPVLWDNRIKRDQLELTAADTAKLDAIARGRLGDHGAANPVAGFGYHCHMRDDGGGGISFAYHHLGGNRVQPAIYDWATKRQNNIYTWRISGTETNKAVKLPGWIKADSTPDG